MSNNRSMVSLKQGGEKDFIGTRQREEEEQKQEQEEDGKTSERGGR